MDLENERRPIKPQKCGKTSNKANETTGMLLSKMHFQITLNSRGCKSADGRILPRHGDGESDE